MTVSILIGDCRNRLRELADGSVNCCVTSPPYFGLRDYGHEGQMGLEAAPDEFVAGMVEVFGEVRRVLRDDGTLWLNIGDSYQNKQVAGVPWKLAEALRADGWLLRQDIIWSKPNPVTEPVKDRCTKAHEYLFLLTKTAAYYYDIDSIRDEPSGRTDPIRSFGSCKDRKDGGRSFALDAALGANKKSVWHVSAESYPEAHFATYPPALIEPCILAGCPKGGTVLDPFGGAGTTGLVADRLQRNAILIELNPAYAEIARKRLSNDGGMFSEVKAA